MMPAKPVYGGRLPNHYDAIIPRREDSLSDADDILLEAEGQEAADKMHDASWSRFVERMGTGIVAGHPRIGLFWFIETNLVTDVVPLLQARLQGSFLTHATSYLETWRQWQRFGPRLLAQYGLPPEIAWTEHASHPHGRVVFCWEVPAFLVYADQSLLASDAMITQVLDAFGLDPAECLLRLNEDGWAAT